MLHRRSLRERGEKRRRQNRSFPWALVVESSSRQKAKGPGFQVDSKDGDTASARCLQRKAGPRVTRRVVTAGVSTPAPPPALTRLQSVQMHERVSQRVEEVQEEIEELEAQVEELMRMSRASRASRRASSANFCRTAARAAAAHEELDDRGHARGDHARTVHGG